MAAEKGQQLSNAVSRAQKKVDAANAELENLAKKVKLIEEKAAAARKAGKVKR